MSEVEVADLEKQKKDAQHYVDLRDAVLRLYDNPDWKKVIIEEFMLHECARYAQQSGAPGLTEFQREDALLIAQAPGALKRFLSAVIQKGNHGAYNIPAIEDAIIDAQNTEDFPDREED